MTTDFIDSVSLSFVPPFTGCNNSLIMFEDISKRREIRMSLMLLSTIGRHNRFILQPANPVVEHRFVFKSLVCVGSPFSDTNSSAGLCWSASLIRCHFSLQLEENWRILRKFR